MKINRKTLLLIIAIIATAGLAIAVLWPKKVNPDNFREISATVYNVTKGKNNDIVLSLKKMRDIYYIGQGIQKGLNVDSLKKQLVGKDVTLLCAKPSIFMQLGPMVSTIQIYSIKENGKVVYSYLPPPSILSF